MDERERRHADLLVTHETGLARRDIELRLQSVFTEHSSKGRLQSGATIIVSVEAMDDVLNTLLNGLAIKLRSVGTNPAVFAMLEAGVRGVVEICRATELPKVMRVVNGTAGDPFEGSTGARAVEEFEKVRAGVERRMQIASYDFAPNTLPPLLSAPAPTIQAQEASTTKGRGGRPPAEFWDDMWASIAAQLYDGRLIPKTQSDLERAMADWIVSNGHEAAPSTIRARARRLADRLEL